MNEYLNEFSKWGYKSFERKLTIFKFPVDVNFDCRCERCVVRLEEFGGDGHEVAHFAARVIGECQTAKNKINNNKSGLKILATCYL